LRRVERHTRVDTGRRLDHLALVVDLYESDQWARYCGSLLKESRWIADLRRISASGDGKSPRQSEGENRDCLFHVRLTPAAGV